MPLPNFLIIGATKAGTTSLHHYIGQHPDVFAAPRKETNFFAQESALCFLGKTIEGLEEYEMEFTDAKTETAIGETSPAYLAVETTPPRIARIIPNIQMIAVLRNPIDRAYSHYLMRVRQGREERSFDQAVEEEDLDPEHSYKTRGFYGEQIERYLAYFPREQLKIFLYEQLLQEPKSTLQECFEFLNVNPNFSVDMSTKHNANPETEPMGTEVRQKLMKLYRKDVDKLQKYISQHVSHWLQ